MPKLSKEENLNRANAADAMLAELGMVEAIEKYNLRGCLSSTEYFNFAFSLWVKHIRRQSKSKRNSVRYKTEHRVYLETDKWKEKRDERLKIDGYRCVDCGKPAQCVHHLHYQTWKHEDIDVDLVSLCNECHYTRHFGQSVPTEH
jgi:5-methylcytosine-specific restriction endonuclease McrA